MMRRRSRSSLIVKEEAFYEAAIATTQISTKISLAHQNSVRNILPQNYDFTSNNHDNSDEMIRVAKIFLSKSCPVETGRSVLETIVSKSGREEDANDRLVKIGRNVSSTLRLSATVDNDQEKTDLSLDLLVSECEQLSDLLEQNSIPATKTFTTDSSKRLRVPKVRFGKTELQMPIVTLGSMRFQQTWNRGGKSVKVKSMEDVSLECQENLVSIIRHALRSGMNHIETAQMYGCSEIQIGAALKVLLESGEVERKELILQTKGAVSASMTQDQLRRQVLSQLQKLQVDYVDLYSFHGLNSAGDYDLLFHNHKLIEVLQQLRTEGKIRFIGFSTHGSSDTILRLIESDAFDYANLHYHWCGSYTCTGDGEYGGNLGNVVAMNARDMGVFAISAYDKGGMLYRPSHKLRSLTLPDMEPITYGSCWLWSHAEHTDISAKKGVHVHTIVCGAARPSDLDQPILAALQFGEQKQLLLERMTAVTTRLEHAVADALNTSQFPNWGRDWHAGLHNWPQSTSTGTMIGNIVWIYNVIHAYGMVDFGRERYNVLINNRKNWDVNKTMEGNVKAMGGGWAWMPGCAFDESLDYSKDAFWGQVGKAKRERVMEAMTFVHAICTTPDKDLTVVAIDTLDKTKKYKIVNDKRASHMPFEWKMAYDMRPWTAYPER
eukprot:CAMPEP_0194354250 /NCGR_PEP_ID=MMETSP0174-20130528/2447_1 /TAXON_ID=216777 /ORGANISM="Proboscia alata, Strain PI-D3" /LENGTH=661 /DNA_ID=CAMNT_0039123139 /DNA_START=37 /DNA_END=2022 /DNA_ORIENTATION=+